MKLAFLHTAQVHAETFDGLLAELGYAGEIFHHVAPEFLDRARTDGLDAVRVETIAALRELSGADAVVCTCSTIGPCVDGLGAGFEHVLRIDQPAMEQACRLGPNPIVAICLESTRAPTLALLDDVARGLGLDIAPTVLFCEDAWPYFERGEFDRFARSIAAAVEQAVKAAPEAQSVLLAQASMRVAEDSLVGLSIPVLSTPMLAAKAAIDTASMRLSR